MRTKAFPLVVSMTLHVVILFAFAIASQEREKVFMVDLVFQDTAYNTRSKLKGFKPEAGNIHKKKISFSKAVIKKEDTDTTLAKQEHKSHSQSPETGIMIPADISDSGTMNRNLGIVTPISSISTFGSREKGGSGTGTNVNSSGNNVIEGEFDSINGPSFLRMVKPEYPYFARRLSKEGKVVLRLFIDEHGRLVSVELIKKAGYGFDEAVIDAVRASIFRPAKLNGHPVACKAVLPVRFRLE